MYKKKTCFRFLVVIILKTIIYIFRYFFLLGMFSSVAYWIHKSGNRHDNISRVNTRKHWALIDRKSNIAICWNEKKNLLKQFCRNMYRSVNYCLKFYLKVVWNVNNLLMWLFSLRVSCAFDRLQMMWFLLFR